MRHAGAAALDSLEPLLGRLRALGGLKETSRGVFYLKSRAFLHFHEDPTGLYADVRGPGEAEFTRLAVDGEAAYAAIVARAASALSGSPVRTKSSQA